MNGKEVLVSVGSEGPVNDPYSFVEYKVKVKNKNVTLHSGLAAWIKVGNKKLNIKYDPNSMWDVGGDKYYELFEDRFEKITGLLIQDIDQAIWEPEPMMCHTCGTNEHLIEKNGYPGEHFTVCEVCNTVIDAQFYESEII
jgi:hypothetical protein